MNDGWWLFGGNKKPERVYTDSEVVDALLILDARDAQDCVAHYEKHATIAVPERNRRKLAIAFLAGAASALTVIAIVI